MNQRFKDTVNLALLAASAATLGACFAAFEPGEEHMLVPLVHWCTGLISVILCWIAWHVFEGERL